MCLDGDDSLLLQHSLPSYTSSVLERPFAKSSGHGLEHHRGKPQPADSALCGTLSCNDDSSRPLPPLIANLSPSVLLSLDTAGCMPASVCLRTLLLASHATQCSRISKTMSREVSFAASLTAKALSHPNLKTHSAEHFTQQVVSCAPAALHAMELP